MESNLREDGVNLAQDLKRMNVRVPLSLHDFYKEQAEQMGVPMNSYLVFVLTEFRKNALAVEFTTRLGKMTPEEQAVVMNQISEIKGA